MSLTVGMPSQGETQEWPLVVALEQPPKWSVSLHVTGRVTVANVNMHFVGDSDLPTLVETGAVKTPLSTVHEAVPIPPEIVSVFRNIGETALGDQL